MAQAGLRPGSGLIRVSQGDDRPLSIDVPNGQASPLKQILQNLKDGSTEIAEVPCPRLAPGHLLLRTTRTLISAGTERMLVDFGKANPLEKARQQPDKVRQVLEKVKTDGLAPTLAAVRNKLEQPLPLGYCHVGVVEAVGGGRPLADAGAQMASTPLSPGPSPTRGEGSKQPGTVMEGGKQPGTVMEGGKPPGVMEGGKPPGVMEGGKQPGALGEGCPTPSPRVGEGRGEGGNPASPLATAARGHAESTTDAFLRTPSPTSRPSR